LAGDDRFLRYSAEELVEIKKLYESVMSHAAHGMFFRTGKILGGRVARGAGNGKDFFVGVATALRKEGWVDVIEFNGHEVVVKGSIEARAGEGPSCHMLRGIITRLYENGSERPARCVEVECVGAGAKRCLFKVEGGDAA
jgi:predicted hydrocarbon binding protein